VDARGRGQTLGIHFDRIPEALQLKLGDSLSFDVAGEPLTVKVGQHPQDSVGQLPAELLSGVSAGAPMDGAAGTYRQVFLTPAQRRALADSGASVPDDLGLRTSMPF